VNEDADMPLRPGGSGSGSGAGGLAGVEGGGLVGAADEYSPEGLDVLDAGGLNSDAIVMDADPTSLKG
jgi:hypothetical protein